LEYLVMTIRRPRRRRTTFDEPVDATLVHRALAESTLGSVWLDDARPTYLGLTGPTRCDLLIVGAGYTGLWTALHAARRHPGARIVIVDAHRVGGAASGRNGGFVEASLTHGAANGRTRWPEEFTQLDALGRDNLDGMQAEIGDLGLDVEWERPGMLTVATEPHQVQWLRQSAAAGEGTFLDRGAIREQVESPTYRAALFTPDTCALVHPGKLASELARACTEAGVSIHEHTPARNLTSNASGCRVDTPAGPIHAGRIVLGTNAFPSLVARNRFHTVPVWDYVLATEPLSAEQLDRVGWRHRQGITDSANQFHYYRLSSDNRIVFGGYDAVYHFGRTVDPTREDRTASYQKLAAHFFLTFPGLREVRFTHRWGGVIDTNTRFCAHWGTAHRGRVAYVNGFTGLGVAATRFAADVCLDLLDTTPTARTQLTMVRRKPMPFPPEPLASIGIQATRWSLDRADHHGGRRNVVLKTLDALGLGFES
jgi:glycine/D-amino acid oxidase-like deaminating enzyme